MNRPDEESTSFSVARRESVTVIYDWLDWSHWTDNFNTDWLVNIGRIDVPIFLDDADPLAPRIREACLRIDETIDFETLLQEVLDSACSLTGACYGILILRENAGQVASFLSSGISIEEAERRCGFFTDELMDCDVETALPEFLSMNGVRSVRMTIGRAYVNDILLVTVSSPISLLVAPIQFRDQHSGEIYVVKTETEREFTVENEKSLILFAYEAGRVVVHRQKEQQTRKDLQTLSHSGLAQPIQPDIVRPEGLVINVDEHRVTVDGDPVALAPKEYELLIALSRNAGRILTHEQLLQMVWGDNHNGNRAMVRNVVKRLRKKLGDSARNSKYISSILGFGYRLEKAEY